MSTQYKFSLGLLVLALVFGGYAYKLGRPTKAEQVFLDSARTIAERGDYSASLVDSLQKIVLMATHEITESIRSEAAREGLDPDEADRRLDALLEDLNRVHVNVRENQEAMAQAAKEKDALDVAENVVLGRISGRASGWWIFSAVLACLAAILAGLKALRLSRRNTERLIHSVFFATASVSIIILFLIMAFLFIEGVPIFKHVPVMDFIFGTEWYPTDDPPAFGIWPLIIGSGAVTVLSSLMAIPLGVMTAIYLAEIAPPKVRNVVKPMVEMLAALPSVVIGFFGMVVVAPVLQNVFGIPTGLNLFNASVMLAFMAVPIITSISEDALYSVPVELKEASLALGATHWQSIWRVMIPASLSGITTAVILGMARAIGETMVVLMVAGGAAMIPGSIFDPVRPMPASIAAEMAEAPFQSEHYYALFATGMVLFIFTMCFNIVADIVAHKYKQVGSATL